MAVDGLIALLYTIALPIHFRPEFGGVRARTKLTFSETRALGLFNCIRSAPSGVATVHQRDGRTNGRTWYGKEDDQRESDVPKASNASRTYMQSIINISCNHKRMIRISANMSN